MPALYPMLRVSCVLLTLSFCLACVVVKTGGAGAEGIDAGNAALMAALKKGDAAAVAACYTRDGMLLPPNAPSASGAQAIQASWKAAMDAGVRDVTLTSNEIEGRGGSAAEVGQYVIKGADGNTIDQGKYIVLWKKEDGVWKLHRDIWNSNAPPPAR